jgi:hypothetical protein
MHAALDVKRALPVSSRMTNPFWLSERRRKSARLPFARKFSLTFVREFLSRDFGTTTSRDLNLIFLLTSFFINSMFQLVATKQRCEFSMNNGRENRNHGNQEKGKEEKEALRKFSTK